MPTTKQIRPHGDRNVVPKDVSPRSNIEHDECPIDEFTLPHMRAADTDE